MAKPVIRLRDVEQTIRVLIALGLEHLVDDVRDAINDNKDQLRFKGDKV